MTEESTPDGARPLIVVPLGWACLRPRVDPLTGQLERAGRDFGANAAELAALEHGLRLADELGGRGVAVTVAGREADVLLREALAAGAAGVLRIEADSTSGHAEPTVADLVDDGRAVAAAIAGAVTERFGAPDFVLCGDRSAERATGTVPAFLAAELSAAQALGVVRLSTEGTAEGTGALLAHRRLDGGRREVLRLRPPAVVSVEAAGVRLRRAGLPAVLAARHADVPVARVRTRERRGAEVVPLGAAPYRPRPKVLAAPREEQPLRRVLDLTGALVDRTPPTVIGPLSASDAADRLLDYLRQHGYQTGDDAST